MKFSSCQYPTLLPTMLFLLALLGFASVQLVLAQDSSGVTRVGSYSRTWDDCNESILSSNHAFVCAGLSGLRVMNVTAPTPVEVSHLLLPGSVKSIALSGHLAVLACDFGGLQIVDINNPLNPTLIASLPIPGRALQVSVTDSMVFVASGVAGVYAINITNPFAPFIISNWTTSGTVAGVCVSGNYAYALVLNSGVRVLDLQNIHTIVELSAIQATALKIRLFGSILCLTNTETLSLYDLTIPAQPRFYWRFNNNSLPSYGSIGGANIIENKLYLGRQYGYIGTHEIFYSVTEICKYDLTQGDSVRWISTTPMTILPKHIAFSNDRFYLSCESEFSFYTESTTSGRLARQGSYSLQLSNLCNLAASANTAFVIGSGLHIFDIQNPTQPVYLNSVSIPYATDVEVSGQYAYVTYDNPTGPAGFKVVDLSDREYPRAIRDLQGYSANGGITIGANHAVIFGNNSRIASRGFNVFDLTIPEQPTHESTLAWETVNGFEIQQNLLYILAESQLWILEIDSSGSTQIVMQDSIAGRANCMAVSGQYVYLGNSTTSSFQVIDCSNRLHPVTVGQMFLTGVLNLSVSGSYCYAATTNGAYVIQVSNPTRPNQAGYTSTASNFSKIAGNQNGVAVAITQQRVNFYNCTNALPVVETTPVTTPNNFSLSPNYPNPFNATTTIKYRIAKSGKVSLKLYDLNGREVAKLVDFQQNPGAYSVTVDGKDLSSGTYFVRLVAGDGAFVSTQKVVLLK